MSLPIYSDVRAPYLGIGTETSDKEGSGHWIRLQSPIKPPSNGHAQHGAIIGTKDETTNLENITVVVGGNTYESHPGENHKGGLYILPDTYDGGYYMNGLHLHHTVTYVPRAGGMGGDHHLCQTHLDILCGDEWHNGPVVCGSIDASEYWMGRSLAIIGRERLYLLPQSGSSWNYGLMLDRSNDKNGEPTITWLNIMAGSNRGHIVGYVEDTKGLYISGNGQLHLSGSHMGIDDQTKGLIISNDELSWHDSVGNNIIYNGDTYINSIRIKDRNGQKHTSILWDSYVNENSWIQIDTKKITLNSSNLTIGNTISFNGKLIPTSYTTYKGPGSSGTSYHFTGQENHIEFICVHNAQIKLTFDGRWIVMMWLSAGQYDSQNPEVGPIKAFYAPAEINIQSGFCYTIFAMRVH